MKKILFGILILTLNSCHLIGKGDGIKFTIKNNSDFSIENVRFTTSENLAEFKFEKIKPNESVSDFLSMEKNKSDGSYVLEFTRLNGKKESKGYGYYTNGGALDSWIEFDIKNDTIIPKYSGMKY
jgi:hypothetical protein